MDSLSHFKEPWKAGLAERSAEQASDLPNSHLADPESLVCASHPASFELGTGASIYTRTLLPALLAAEHEVILVTCFWAPSATLRALSEALLQLAEKRRDRARHAEAGSNGEPTPSPLPELRVRICFSSRSLLQKLLHTSSRGGYVYPAASWPAKLGLPPREVLEAGRIDLRVKSLFFLPFSVMHPKFLVVDRRRAFLPSCNVSWEPWLEGCVEVAGDEVVGRILRFYRDVWDGDLQDSIGIDDGRSPEPRDNMPHNPSSPSRIGLSSIHSPATLFKRLNVGAIPTILLPSSHHRNPKFHPFPWQSSADPPATPLNHAILRLLDMSQGDIYMQTPNLTSAAVVEELLEALQRGVDVTVVTSKNMMLLEQLVTAGTTTLFCLQSFIRRYLQRRAARAPRANGAGGEDVVDLEAQDALLGRLRISYYRPRPQGPSAPQSAEEPVQSHLKLTIVDGQYTVLGSGNMDRASWFTSQELGILFQSAGFAKTVRESVDEVLRDRLDVIFDSDYA